MTYNFYVSKLSDASLDKATRAALNNFVRIVGEANLEDYSLRDALLKWNQVLEKIHCVSATSRNKYRACLEKQYSDFIKYKKHLGGSLEPFKELEKLLVSSINAEGKVKDDATKEEKGSDKPARKRKKADDVNTLALGTCRYLHRSDFPDDLNVYADLVLLSALNAGADYELIAQMQYGDDTFDLSNAQNIVERNNHRKEQRYVLPLRQWSGRKLQIKEKISQLLAMANSRCPVDDVALMAWIEAALNLGYSDRQIRATISRVPEIYSYLEAVEPDESLDDVRIKEIKSAISKSILDELNWWYLVRLFKPSEKLPTESDCDNKVIQSKFLYSAENVKRRLKEEFNDVKTVYPMQTVVTVRSGKKIAVTKPLIPNYMMVRLDPRDLGKAENIAAPDGHFKRKGVPYGTIPNQVVNYFVTSNAVFVSQEDLEGVKEDELELGNIVEFKAKSVYGQHLFEVIDIKTKSNGNKTGSKEVAIVVRSLTKGYKFESTASQVKLYKAAIAKKLARG